MKKLIIPCLLVLLISGCGKIAPQLDVNKKIYNTFSNMQGYEAVLKVNTVSNTNNNTFDTKQYYKYPDKMRSETDGVVTIMEGGRATVQNTAVGQPLKIEQIPSDESDYMFLQNFFAAYYRNEETSAVVNSDKSNIITLQVDTGLSNPYRSSAELKMDTGTMKPISMELKGKDGKTYVKIEYVSFQINQNLGDSLFQIE